MPSEALAKKGGFNSSCFKLGWGGARSAGRRRGLPGFLGPDFFRGVHLVLRGIFLGSDLGADEGGGVNDVGVCVGHGLESADPAEDFFVSPDLVPGGVGGDEEGAGDDEGALGGGLSVGGGHVFDGLDLPGRELRSPGVPWGRQTLAEQRLECGGADSGVPSVQAEADEGVQTPKVQRGPGGIEKKEEP